MLNLKPLNEIQDVYDKTLKLTISHPQFILTIILQEIVKPTAMIHKKIFHDPLRNLETTFRTTWNSYGNKVQI